MFAKTILAALTAAVVGIGAFAGSTAPAAADGFSFGIQFGEPGWGHHRYDRHWNGGWQDHRWNDRREHRWNDRRDRRWQRGRSVQVCEPTWRVKRFADDYGRVYKVVRVRETECRWVRR
jgi:hypothetical protein